MDSPTPCEVAIVPSPSGRRTFLRWCTAICGAIAATFLSIPVVGYFFGLRKHSVDWVDLGHVNEFPLNQTRRIDFDNPLRQPWDGMTALTGVYVRYEGKNDEREDQFLVLSINCAHLGCPVSWFQQSGLFMCPCHGGVYYSDGEHASGPPPRGLYHCVWRAAERPARDSSSSLSDAPRPTRPERLTKKATPMFGWLKKIGNWVDARIGFSDTLLPMMRHPVPRAIDGPVGWWYVFGSASLTLFLIQIVTGIGLSLVYVPAADKAYESLLYLDYQQPLGWFLRALHYYAGSGNGRHAARAHDASFSPRGVQISA